jgi:LPS export ABC transporter permease LptG/LPS export ABC transporter permease LptF
MRKIDKLLFRSIIPPFLISLTVLTFVIFIQQLGSKSEWLFARSASFDIILTGMGAILPAILIFSLPLSFLIGLLVGLSGLSGDNQITALRACGIPLRSLLRFILLLAVFVGAITALFSLFILPRTNDVIRKVQNRIDLTQATALIQPRVFNEDFPNIVFYIEDIDSDRQNWSGVFLADNSDPQFSRIVIARSAMWISDPSQRRLQLHLEKGASYPTNPEDSSKDYVSEFTATDFTLNSKFNMESVAEMDRRPKKVSEQSSYALWNNYPKSPPEVRLKQLIELNKRLALPFSVFPFAFLGLTLAVSTPKGGRTYGFVLSLGTVIIFYMLFINGLRLADVGKISPWLGAWSADILILITGLFLLAKVEQGFSLGYWISKLLWKSHWEALIRRFHLEKVRNRIIILDNAVLQKTSRVARFRFPKILDLYISKGFLVHFGLSLATCGVLFVLFTLFDLLDDIIRNKISLDYVAVYFIFLSPQILMIVVPMSVLLAILISFGILEKNSEITAIKAGGWSLYRTAIPVILIAACFCISLFIIQDYVLRYSNDRQDSMHNVIKGKPPQTSRRLQRKWIFGESGRIYNYEYFDGSQDSFVALNVFEMDMKETRVLRLIHADRAHIDPNGVWTLENGWIRDYQSAQSSYRQIKNEMAKFPEKAGYFEREIFQPKESSKKTYPELSKYINDLMISGYNATELQVELYKKISFPLSCLVMALLGIPFSFSMGKKGAFFGIGLSIAIAISYWGISGIFEAMGAYGLLIPILAAWAPNILFGAAGLVLLLTIRT